MSGCSGASLEGLTSLDMSGFLSDAEQYVSDAEQAVNSFAGEVGEAVGEIGDAAADIAYQDEERRVYDAVQVYFNGIRSRYIKLAYEIPYVGEPKDDSIVESVVTDKAIHAEVDKAIMEAYSIDEQRPRMAEEIFKGLEELTVVVSDISIGADSFSSVYPFYEGIAYAHITVIYKDYAPVITAATEQLNSVDKESGEQLIEEAMSHYGLDRDALSNEEIAEASYAYLIDQNRHLAITNTSPPVSSVIWLVNGEWEFQYPNTLDDWWYDCCTCGLFSFTRSLG